MRIQWIVRQYPLATYFLFTYGISWILWLIAQLIYPLDDPMADPGPGVLLLILGTFGPFIAAVIVSWTLGTLAEVKARLFRWRVAPRWYIVAVGLPAGSGIVTYAIYRLLGGTPIDFSQLLPVPALVVMFVFTLLAGGGNEEPGWRGFALPRLQRRYGPTVGTGLLAVLWAGWHLPAFFNPASSQSMLPVAAWAVGVLAISFVLTWLFNVTAESVPVAAIFHTSFNVVALWLLSGLPVDAVAHFYWIGVIIFSIVAIALILLTRAELGVSESTLAS